MAEVGANIRLDIEAEAAGKTDTIQQIARPVLEMLQRYQLQQRTLRPADSLAIQGDADRQQVRDLSLRLRALPEENQNQLPALLAGLAKLEMAAGEFDLAQRDFLTASAAITDPKVQGEIYFDIYQTALERRDGKQALQFLQRAVASDAERFAPFPFSRFEPEQILGVESTGIRFLCRDRTSGVHVVVKALWPQNLDLAPDEIFGLARLLDDLGHAVMPRLRECGYADPGHAFPYVVSEHFEGPSLADLFRQHGQVSIADLPHILKPVAEALFAAHERSILHRNIKPTKVLVKHSGGAWQVRIIDFCLAPKRPILLGSLNSGPYWSKSVVGTSAIGALPYVPPEELGLLEGVPVGPASDLYSLAKTCYFAVLGTPEPDDDEKETLPPAWRKLLGQCVSRTATRRLPSVAMLLKRLATLPPPAAPAPAPAPAPLTMPATAPVPGLTQELQNLVMRGNAFRQQGDFNRAIASYTRAIELNPADASFYLKRANAYSDRGDHDRAIADYSTLLRLDPHNALGFMNRGLAHAKKGQYERVIADCNEAIRLDPKLAAAYYVRGVAHANRGERPRAIAEFSQAIKLDPQNSLAYNDRGLCFVEDKAYDRAITDFTAALRIDPRLSVAYVNRGIAFRHKGELNPSLADLTRALKLEPRNLQAYYHRGLSFLARGGYQQAATDFARVLRLDPKHAEAAKHKEEALQALAKAQPAAKPKAAASAKSRAEQEEEERRQVRAAAYFAKGRSLFDQGDYNQAIEQFTKAIEADPQDALALHHRGLAHAAKDQYTLALADYTSSLKLSPRNPIVYYQRGIAHRLAGQYDRAIADYSRAIKLDPRMGLAYRNRGLAYAAKGDEQRAKADYERAIRLDPSLAKE